MREIYNDGCLYKDTYTIIKMMDKDMQNRISSKFIEFLKENQDEDYISSIDSKKPLKKQELREEIKLMLSLIYINYLCSEEEEEKIEREEKIRIEEYNKSLYDNMFKRKKYEENTQVTDLVVVKEKNIIEKIIDKIRQIFSVKNK